jgi:hypothetical protein
MKVQNALQMNSTGYYGTFLLIIPFKHRDFFRDLIKLNYRANNRAHMAIYLIYRELVNI